MGRFVWHVQWYFHCFQVLSCTHLAHHQPESVNNVIIVFCFFSFPSLSLSLSLSLSSSLLLSLLLLQLLLFFQAVGTAVDTFLMVLDTHKWTSMPSMAARSRGRSSSSADPAAAASSDAAAPSSASNGAHGVDPSTPPYALMDHVPLAIFVNGLLSAFNELRHCAPLSLATALASILQVRSKANVW